MASRMTKDWRRTASRIALAGTALAALGLATAAPAVAQYRQEVRNDVRQCAGQAGPAVLVTVNGVSSSSGVVRVQAYRATAGDWLQKGRWLSRIEEPARAGTMTFCVPLPAAGSYGIAVRHDANGNGETDLRQDGGGMSNNPSINIFNLGRPSHTSTAIPVGNTVSSIRIRMRYM
jgi:uncharacterized protein (DUF2141 family)